MNRITMEIYVPAADRTFDVTVPSQFPLWQVTSLAAKSLSELSGGLYQADETAVLCDRESGQFLNANMMVWELGLMNGSRLMLI